MNKRTRASFDKLLSALADETRTALEGNGTVPGRRKLASLRKLLRVTLEGVKALERAPGDDVGGSLVDAIGFEPVDVDAIFDGAAHDAPRARIAAPRAAGFKLS